ncbi:type I toxin-antitoxin system Ibs family toxin [Kluyvera huaxiensis]
MTGIKQESPSDEGALYKERVMMNMVIILVILLVISLPAY